MSAIDIESLLSPVSEESPCGEDLEYNAEFMALEQDVEGSAEIQMGEALIEAEEPNWKDIQQRAIDLLDKTRDLRLLIILLRAGMRLDGYAAIANTLNVLSGWAEQFWDQLYPTLDPDDDNDPTERVNILMTLCDLDVIIQPILQTPVVNSKALGEFSLQDIRASEDPESTEQAPEPATIRAAFTDAELDDLLATHTQLQTCIEKTQHLEDTVTDLVGVSNAPNLALLVEIFQEADSLLAAQISEKGGLDKEASENGPDDGSSSKTGQALQGDIRNSQDVIKAIEKICDYYKKNEPSSPIPILLERAQRLVNMDFMSIVRDLASEGVSQVETFIGEQEEEDDD